MFLVELSSSETNCEKQQKLDSLHLNDSEWEQAEKFVKILEVCWVV